ncbi:MAG: GGDEF domain-containing protein [Rhizobiales bacterium]|nr:GGDEF domain-containing protein [Hyphomicrobiales bacterium]
MSGAAFILAINLTVVVFLATAFFVVAAYDRGAGAGRWFGSAYLVGGLYYAIELAIHFLGYGDGAVIFGAAVLLAGLTVFNVGIARHHRIRPPVVLCAVVSSAGVIATLLAADMPRYSLERMLAFQAPYALMQVIAAWTTMRARRKTLSDYVLAGLFTCAGIQFLSKPFIASAVGGWGERPSAYLDSNYALISQSLATVFALGIALTLIIKVVHGMVAEATARSETDTLSGLLNRRGFETRAARAVERANRHGFPLCIVVCDLDHFKAVNDTYGHAAGDRVLVSFAALLKESLTEKHVAGRIGGEEFVSLLSGVNLSTARLFAEGARTAFSARTMDGLPSGHRCTASFGVAQLQSGESLASLMARADAALYAAKRGGRDRVHVSQAGLALVHQSA